MYRWIRAGMAQTSANSKQDRGRHDWIPEVQRGMRQAALLCILVKREGGIIQLYNQVAVQQDLCAREHVWRAEVCGGSWIIPLREAGLPNMVVRD